MNDPKLIRHRGDYLEAQCADRILTQMPGYALFWATYIGNDGDANYLPMPGVSKEVLDTRVYLWEHLYTLFESFALCWKLEEDFAALKAVTSPDEYANNLNCWIAFYAHLGRIHDMAEKVASGFQGENLYTPFDEFNETRHTVLHYPKVPMRLAENVLAAPRLGEKPKDWKQGMRWADLKHEDFQFLADIVSSTLRELEKVTNKFLFKIAELAKTQKHLVPIQWPEHLLTASGVTLKSPPTASSAVGQTETGVRSRNNWVVNLSGVSGLPSQTDGRIN